jgi:hypothetical protein
MSSQVVVEHRGDVGIKTLLSSDDEVEIVQLSCCSRRQTAHTKEAMLVNLAYHGALQAASFIGCTTVGVKVGVNRFDMVPNTVPNTVCSTGMTSCPGRFSKCCIASRTFAYKRLLLNGGK